MNPFEIDEALDGMVVLVDTREQDTSRLRARLKQMDCPNERMKLDFGDYSAKFPLPNGEWFSLADKVVVERKMHLDELCRCYCQDRKRFEREFERAKEAGAKMYLLVENATWESAYAGKYRSQMRSTALIASMCAWLARYDCQLLMCKPETTGKLIHDVLYREGKEILEHLEVDCEDNKTTKLEKAANK
jgi:ERCC4-type nuclease